MIDIETNFKEIKPIYFFLLTFFIGIVFNYLILKDMQQLPSPIFGGDFWNHLASVYHLYYGGSFFDSGELLNEMPWVPRFFHFLVWIQAIALNIDPLVSIINISYLLYFIGVISIYFFAREEKNGFGILLIGLLMLSSFPIFKYTDFSIYVLSFVFFLSYYNFIKESNLKNAILFGIISGIGTLTNIQLAISIFLVFMVHVILTVHNFCKGNYTILMNLLNDEKMKNFLIAFTIAMLFFMTYYYKPIFEYYLHTANPTHIYGWADFSDLSISLNYIFSDILISYASSPSMFIYILGFGLAIYLFFKSENARLREALLVFIISMLIALLHHLITFPLFHIHFAPERMFLMFFVSIAYSGFFYFKFENRHFIYLILAVFALIASATFHFNNYTSSNYYKMSLNPIDPIISNPANWIKNNTEVNDVFLSDNENSFAYNSLTGRKFVSYRRTHTSIYADMNKRNIDSAIILYGKNNELRKKLLLEYNVKYLIWNAYWLQNSITFDETGSISSFFDPFLIPYSKETELILNQNGVNTVQIVYYLDPAYVPTYPKYRLLVVIPNQDYLHPWDSTFDSYLKEVYSYNSNGIKTVRIFEVNIK